VDALNADNAAPAEAQVTEQASQETNHAAPEQNGQNGERRERRSRDRYGRDRRERGDATQETVASDNTVGQTEPEVIAAPEFPAQRSYFDRAATAAPAAQAPAATTAEPEAAQPVAAPAPVLAPAAAPGTEVAPAGMPKVQAYQLPLTDLQQIAAGSGLQWVNSDADKVAAVQAAIAAEPKPVHVPRERAPVVVIDEGPLVLVETRKDLSEMKLPF
jgi:ribonuclease E